MYYCALACPSSCHSAEQSDSCIAPLCMELHGALRYLAETKHKYLSVCVWCKCLPARTSPVASSSRSETKQSRAQLRIPPHGNLRATRLVLPAQRGRCSIRIIPSLVMRQRSIPILVIIFLAYGRFLPWSMGRKRKDFTSVFTLTPLKGNRSITQAIRQSGNQSLGASSSSSDSGDG